MGIIISINGADFEPYHQAMPLSPLVRETEPTRKSHEISRNDAENLSDNFGSYLKRAKGRVTQAYTNTGVKSKKSIRVQKAKDLMSTPVFVLRPEDSVELARVLMAERSIRHLPIVNQDDKIVGIVSDRSLALSSGQAVISNYMTRNIIAAVPETSLQEIAITMMKAKISSVPILDPDRKIVGIVTTTDLLKSIIDQPSLEVWG